ncbi:5-oxoprolinase [Flagelloscypha sp. PMI_526]|nr:5-oxoprolinase [Flagelloscypha sp. PMI_526]
MSQIPPHSLRIHIDRGGTFCDVHASWPGTSTDERQELVIKLLSSDPGNYADAPTEGIRRVLEKVSGTTIKRGDKLSMDLIERIRLSTTLATNALLERRGTKHALCITKGFRDLLLIGNQSRPKIFDLNIRRPEPLYEEVIEIDERVTIVGYTSDPLYDEKKTLFDESGAVIRDGYSTQDEHGQIVRGISGEGVRILQRPDPDAIHSQLQALHSKGYKSLAIVFMHSYTYPDHEEHVKEIAHKVGFEFVSTSNSIGRMIKVLPRGTSTTVDAYLTPILRKYLEGFWAGFDLTEEDKARVEFMTSDGGLVSATHFTGLKSILSGPAGGVVGYALTSYSATHDGRGVIGLDVGGTSTDVSRFQGQYERTQETITAGVNVMASQLDVNTVAAGGGSCLTFKAGLCRAGPESAGADPGPRCYRKNGPLALTDANLLLGRLIPEYFPKIFGKDENEGLDIEASRLEFEKLAAQVNEGSETKLGFDEVVYGFIKVANETMCRPIRALTEARGYATGKHILASFGGAGGQHACEIAELLGIHTILIHRYSSILSAYGLALADRAYELSEPTSTAYNEESEQDLEKRLDSLEEQVRSSLTSQGFAPENIHTERLLNMRFDGTDTSLMVQRDGGEGYEGAFKRIYKGEFGFLLEGSRVVVDDVKVRGTGKTYSSLGPSVFEELKSSAFTVTQVDPSRASLQKSVYFDKLGRVDNVGVWDLGSLRVGEKVAGPAIIIDDTQTIVVCPDWWAVVTRRHLVIEREDPDV